MLAPTVTPDTINWMRHASASMVPLDHVLSAADVERENVAIINTHGALLGSCNFPTTAEGYRRLLD